MPIKKLSKKLNAKALMKRSVLASFSPNTGRKPIGFSMLSNNPKEKLSSNHYPEPKIIIEKPAKK